MLFPRHAVCVLGTWSTMAPVERLVRTVGGPGFALEPGHSRCEPDGKLVREFELAADRVKPTLRREDREAILRHRAVAYVLSPPIGAEDALALSTRMLAVIVALLDGGAGAAKSESSGLGHGAARWRELAARAASARRRGHAVELADALLHAWVRRPLREDKLLHSCGLHLLGARDVEVDEGKHLAEDLAWLDLLALYQLAEQRAHALRAGEVFRLRPDGEGRLLQLTSCERYGKADFAYNPYGYWRLVRPPAA